MSTSSIKLTVKSNSHSELITITRLVADAIQELGLRDGVAHVFVRHTTCGLTINENADPAVKTDLLRRLEALAPWNDSKDRHMEGNSAAHLKSTFLGASVSVPVVDGQMMLGTWQGIFLGEFDGPRTRTLMVTALSSSSA